MAQRRKHTGQFKARVAIEAITGHKTINEISSEYGVHASQIHKWKKEALERLPEVLDEDRHGRREAHEAVESRLYQQIGQWTMEVDLKDDGVGEEARWGGKDYLVLYNSERPHQSLGDRTDAEVYFGGQRALGPGMAVPASLANGTEPNK